MVTARLERDVGGGTGGLFARCLQGVHFGLIQQVQFAIEHACQHTAAAQQFVGTPTGHEFDITACLAVVAMHR